MLIMENWKLIRVVLPLLRLPGEKYASLSTQGNPRLSIYCRGFIKIQRSFSARFITEMSAQKIEQKISADIKLQQEQSATA